MANGETEKGRQKISPAEFSPDFKKSALRSQFFFPFFFFPRFPQILKQSSDRCPTKRGIQAIDFKELFLSFSCCTKGMVRTQRRGQVNRKIVELRSLFHPVPLLSMTEATHKGKSRERLCRISDSHRSCSEAPHRDHVRNRSRTAPRRSLRRLHRLRWLPPWCSASLSQSRDILRDCRRCSSRCSWRLFVCFPLQG